MNTRIRTVLAALTITPVVGLTGIAPATADDSIDLPIDPGTTTEPSDPADPGQIDPGVEEPAPEPEAPVEQPAPEPETPVEEPAPEPEAPVEEPAPEPEAPVEQPAPAPQLPQASAPAATAPAPAAAPAPAPAPATATPVLPQRDPAPATAAPAPSAGTVPSAAPVTEPAPAEDPADVPLTDFQASLFQNGVERSDIPDRYLFGQQEYVVISGDTLSDLAEHYDVPGGWQTIWQDNRDIIEDPDLIYPGQTILLRLS